MLQLRKATRKQTKLRIGLSGASGFGKTYSALLLAYGLCGDWEKVAVIDTENSARDYSDLGPFNILALSAPFTPEIYIEALKVCANAGMEVVIIDSATHEWAGPGGCLEIVDALTATSRAKNSFASWGPVTPRHNAFVDAMLGSPCHVIATTRRKQAYEQSKGDNGRTTVQKVGTAEVQRDGWEYELKLNFEMVNDAHEVRASKDRTGLFMGKPEFVIGIETGRALAEWANQGEPDEVIEAVKWVRALTDKEQVRTAIGTHPLRDNPTFRDAAIATGIRLKQQEEATQGFDPSPALTK